MKELALVLMNRRNTDNGARGPPPGDTSFTDAATERLLIEEDNIETPPTTFLSKVKYYSRRCFMKVKAFILWCHNKKILPIIFFIPLYIANHLYMSSDETCPKGNILNCLFGFVNERITTWILKVFIAAVIFGALMIAPFYSKRIVPYYICILAVINVIYLLFFFDNTLTFKDYGRALAYALAIDLLCVFAMFGIFMLILYCYRKEPRITIITVALLLVTFVAWFYFSKVWGSCDHWAKGLGGDQINNDVTCKIPTPSICQYDILEGAFDLSVKDCSEVKPDFELMEEHYAHTGPIIGLPRIEHLADKDRTWNSLTRYVLKHSVALESLEDPAAKDLEIFIDQRDKDNAKLIIDLKRNQTLVDERKKLQDDDGLAKNIIVIFIDTLSRARFYKKLPKTAAWFEKYYGGKSSERESYQFFKFHGVTPFTSFNVLALNYGLVPDYNLPPPAPENKPRNFVGGFKDKGYITGMTGNVCVAFYSVQASKVAYLKDTAYDHEGQTFSCDPNYHDPVAAFSATKGAFSFERKCLYGLDTFHHYFNYGDQFMRAYAEEKKMLYLEILDGHEPTQEAIKYMDTSMVNFFENLDRDGLMDDTMIMLWSDHGMHLPFPPYNMFRDNVVRELGLPNLIFLLPQGMVSKFGAAVKSNQQKLFSAYQLHELLMAFPNGVNSSHLAMSPLSTLPQLTCDDAKVVLQECQCNYP